MFGAMSTIASAFLGNGGKNMLIATVLAASLVSGQSVVSLLLVADSSIGESDIHVVGGVLHGSIIGSDSTATTYDVKCALTAAVSFPFTTPACVTDAHHVTITQGPHTASMTEVFVAASTSQNVRAGCTFDNSKTVTCSITETVRLTTVIAGDTSSTSYTDTSSGVQSSPNGPLYVPVTITAGQANVNGAATPAATTTPVNTGASSAPTDSSQPLTIESRASFGVKQAVVEGKWILLLSLFMIAYLA